MTPPEPSTPLSVVSRRLANGARLLCVQRPGPARVSLLAAVGVGASADPAGRAGLAHFLEHLVCGHWKDMLGLMDERLRAAFHAKTLLFDAETQLDHTLYKASFPLELLAEFAAFDAARWEGRLIEPEPMARSLPGILHELENFAPSLPTGRLYRALYSLVYGDHPYGRYTFGRAEDIGRLTFEECRGFFDAHYGADSLVLAAVSPCSPAELADALEPRYAALRPRPSAPFLAPCPPAPKDARWETASGDAGEESLLLAGIRLPAPSDARAAALLRALNEYVVRSLRRSGARWHGFLPAMRGGALWELLGADPLRGSAELRAELHAELERVGVSDEALEEISGLLSALPGLIERAWKDPFVLAEELALAELLGPGWVFALERREAAGGLRPEDLRALAAERLRSERVFSVGADKTAPARSA